MPDATEKGYHSPWKTNKGTDKVEKTQKDADYEKIKSSALPDLNKKKIIVKDDDDAFDLDNYNVIDLKEKERKDIETELHEGIKKSEEDMSDLISDLEEWSDMYEMNPDASKNDDPWPGASNTRSPHAAVHTRGKKARYLQSIFGVEPYYLIELAGKESSKKELSKKIQDWLQFLCKKVIKLPQKCQGSFFNADAYGTGWLKLRWKYTTKRKRVLTTYNSIEELELDFADYKDAGIDEQEYNKLKGKLETEGFITIPVEKDVIDYNAPFIDSYERQDFITIPAQVPNLESAKGKFGKIRMTWDELRHGEAEGKYSNLEEVKDKAVTGTSLSSERVSQQRDYDEGKQKELGVNHEDKLYNVYEGIYLYDYNDDGIREECICTYVYDESVLIRMEVLDDNLSFIPFYIEPRNNRLDGIGTCKKLQTTSELSDTLSNLEANVARMVTSPAFKGLKGSSFDPLAQEYYPGVTFWLDNFDEFEQVVIISQFPELKTLRAGLERQSEQLSGFSSGMSGRESPQDPTAPGIKTASLIREANILINDEITNLRWSMEELGYQIVLMCSKYLNDDDKYLGMFGLKRQDLEVAREEIMLHGISVSSNKDIKKQEDIMIYKYLRPDPMIAKNPKAVRSLIEDLVYDFDKDKTVLLPTDQELKEEQIQILMEAMRRREIMQKRDAIMQKLIAKGIPAKRAEAMVNSYIQQGMAKGAVNNAGEGMPEEQMETTEMPQEVGEGVM